MAALTFATAQEAVKNLTKRPSNEELLDLYALYKQGTEGNVKGDRPGMLNVKERAKYDAWSKRKDLKNVDAQSQYVKLVEGLLKKYS